MYACTKRNEYGKMLCLRNICDLVTGLFTITQPVHPIMCIDMVDMSVLTFGTGAYQVSVPHHYRRVHPIWAVQSDMDCASTPALMPQTLHGIDSCFQLLVVSCCASI